MFTFFTIVFGLIWAVLSISKSHVVQMAAMAIVWLVIFGIPAWLWMKIFG